MFTGSTLFSTIALFGSVFGCGTAGNATGDAWTVLLPLDDVGEFWAKIKIPPKKKMNNNKNEFFIRYSDKVEK